MKKINAFVIYINFIFFLIVLGACYKVKDMDFILITLLYLIGVFVYIFYEKILKKPSYKTICTLSIISVLLAIYLFEFDKINQKIIEIFYEKGLIIIDSIHNYADMPFIVIKPYLILVIPFISLLFMYLYKHNLENMLLLGEFILLTTLWLLRYDVNISKYINYFVFLCTVSFMINMHIKKIQKVGKIGVKSYVNIKNTIIYILVFSTFIAVLVNFMPKNKIGKYEKTVQNKIDKLAGNSSIEEITSDGTGKEYFSDFKISGMNDNSDTKLGGKVKLDDKIVMKIKADSPVYLRGSCKVRYNGFEWQNEMIERTISTDGNELNYFDYRDTQGNNLSSLFNVLDYVDKKGSKKTMEVDIVNPEAGGNIFTPIYSYSVTKLGANSNESISSNTGTLIFESSAKQNYKINYFENSNLDLFDNLYKNGVGKNYSIESYNNDIDTMNLQNGVYNYIYYNNLQYSDTVTERTKTLVNSITIDCKDNMDKVEKIKEYLNQNYYYSLDVSKLPDNTDFVDYFLFTEKKGYCTYFATAMTIMCRIAGIPARYVEGVMMPNNKDSKGYYSVSNADAHAWCEVLVLPDKNYWAIVESTPGYKLDSKDNSVQKPVNNNNEAKKPEVKANTPEKNNIKPKTNDVTNKSQIKINFKSFINKYIMLISVLLIVFIIIMFSIIKIIIYYVKVSRVLTSKSLVPLYKFYIKRLRSIKLIRKSENTDMEFAAGIEDEFLRDKICILTNEVYKEYYGNKNTKLDKKEYYHFIEKYLKSRQNKFKYWFKKYIFNI